MSLSRPQKFLPYRIMLAWVVLTWLLFQSSPLSAATNYYVSPTGNDTNTGTQASPFRQIRRALTSVQPGDTVYVADGSYLGFDAYDLHGAAASPITIKAVGSNAVVTPTTDRSDNRDTIFITFSSYLVLDGLRSFNANRAAVRIDQSPFITIRNGVFGDNATWGIFTDYSDDMLLEHNECYGSKTQHGIYFSNSGDRPIIRDNLLHDNAGCGLQLNADPSLIDSSMGTTGDGITDQARIEGNIIYNNGVSGGAAINLASVRRAIIVNNLLFSNLAGGIAGWDDGDGNEWGSMNNVVVNNTIYFAPGKGRWCVSFKDGSTGNIVQNNILYGGAHGSLEYDDSSSIASDFNLLYSSGTSAVATDETTGVWMPFSDWQSGGNDLHSRNADPQFLSIVQADFHLQAGSLGINTGNRFAPQLPLDDLNGKPRIIGSAPDLGAYEFGTLNTLLTVVNVTAPAGQPVLLRALLRRFVDGAGVVNEPLTFHLDGTLINTITTAANGTVGFLYTLPANITAGKHTIDVDFAGDVNYAPAHGPGTLTVAYPIVLTAPSVSGKIGQNVLLRSLLRRLPDAAGVSGKATDFYLDGTKVGTATTASNGTASLSYTLPANLSPGSHTLTFKFAGDSDYTASQGTATLTAQYQSVLTIAAASGKAGQNVLLRAALRRLPDAAFVPGKTLAFLLDGTSVGTVATPTAGTANLVYTLPANTTAGSHTLTVSFAGDSDYLPISGTATVTVNP